MLHTYPTAKPSTTGEFKPEKVTRVVNNNTQLNLLSPPTQNDTTRLQLLEESSFSPDFIYYLLTPFGWRVPCPLTEEEATKVLAKTEGWDFTPASTDSLKPRCWGNLELVLTRVCGGGDNA